MSRPEAETDFKCYSNQRLGFDWGFDWQVSGLIISSCYLGWCRHTRQTWARRFHILEFRWGNRISTKKIQQGDVKFYLKSHVSLFDIHACCYCQAEFNCFQKVELSRKVSQPTYHITKGFLTDCLSFIRLLVKHALFDTLINIVWFMMATLYSVHSLIKACSFQWYHAFVGKPFHTWAMCFWNVGAELFFQI